MLNGKNKLKSVILILPVFMSCIIGVFPVFAAGPGTITYQGTVTDSGGAIPPDNSYAMRFTLFDALSSGAQKWQETHSGGNAVPVTNGCFSALLGSITAFPATLFKDNANLWLEVEVDLNANGFEGSEKYSPRVSFTAAPYAFQSDRATTATFAQSAQSAQTAQSALKNLIRDFVVASGESVSAGDVVVFINETVKKGSGSPDFGSEYVYNSAATDYNSAATLSETQFVVAFRDVGNSNYGTAMVGEVSGNVVTYGSEYVYNSASTDYISAAALSETKFVVAFRDVGNSNYGTAMVGNVSGNVISFGSEYVFNSATTEYISAAALSETKFLVAYEDGGNSTYGTARVGEVSDTVISYGSEYVYNTQFTAENSLAALSDTKFVIIYYDDYWTEVMSVAGEVSGNVISYGPEKGFVNQVWRHSVAALSDTKFIIAFRDIGNSNYGTALVGEVSGTVISYGLDYVYNSASTDYISATALSKTKFLVAYQDGRNFNYGTAVMGEVSENAIIFGHKYVYNSGQTEYISTAALSDLKFVVAYRDVGNSSYGTAVACDFVGIPLGIADSAASSGQSVPVILQGISDHHSGLVPGKFYYAQPDGSLTAKDTYTRVGLAISLTELLLDIER